MWGTATTGIEQVTYHSSGSYALRFSTNLDQNGVNPFRKRGQFRFHESGNCPLLALYFRGIIDGTAVLIKEQLFS
jgi:hypothetical protein